MNMALNTIANRIDNNIFNSPIDVINSQAGDAKNVNSKANDLEQMSKLADQIVNLADQRNNQTPELKLPTIVSDDTKNIQLTTLADNIKNVMNTLDGKDSSPDAKAARAEPQTQTAGYSRIKEQAFAALYAKLLELFAALNIASSDFTAKNVVLAETLAKSSANNLISGANAQKSQAIVSAVVTMGVSGIGTAQTVKGLNQQKMAVNPNKLSNTTNNSSNSLRSTTRNGANITDTSPSSTTSPSTTSTSVRTTNQSRAGAEEHVDFNLDGTGNRQLSDTIRIEGQKTSNTGQTVSNMGTTSGNLAGSDYTVQSATANGSSSMDQVAKDTMLEAENKNRDGQSSARNSLKALLDLIYQAQEKNNEAISHAAQMLKV